jgi:ElaB/YqjD/DUF883 family membrane-anchored ribosome-binding protein
VSAGFFTFGLEDVMNETKEKTAERVNKAKDHVQCEAGATTCRTILIAACMGVLIGLLLKR